MAPEFIQECVRVLNANEAVVMCSPATVLINEDGSPLRYSTQKKGMVDNYGRVWPVTPEKNALLMSADPTDRYSEVLLKTFMALEIYGLIRRSALERTSVMPSYFGGDKIVLAQLSLIGRYHLLSEPLFYRRCHPGQFSYQRSDGPTWFSGKNNHMFVDQLRVLVGYTRAALSAKLTLGQQCRCISAIWQRAVTRGKPLRRLFIAVVE